MMNNIILIIKEEKSHYPSLSQKYFIMDESLEEIWAEHKITRASL